MQRATRRLDLTTLGSLLLDVQTSLRTCHKKCQPEEEIAPRCSEMSHFQLEMTTFLKESRFITASEGGPKGALKVAQVATMGQQSSRLVTRNVSLKRKLYGFFTKIFQIHGFA